jgi:hypothetical protein
LRAVCAKRLAQWALVGAAILGVAACGPRSFRQATCVDPTDDCNWSVVVVANDTTRPVTLRVCVHHCGKGDQRLDPITVLPSRRSPATQYGGIYALTGSQTWVAVQSYDGKTTGCLVLDGHPDKRDGDLVRVSEMTVCGDARTSAAIPVGRVNVQSP